MTKGGVCIVLAEQCILAYSIYAIPYYLYKGWWEDLIHNGFHSDDIPNLVKVIVFFTLLFLCQLCFLCTSFTNPGWISDINDMKRVLLQEGGAPLEYLEKKSNGKARSCAKCKAPKPDRAHHCSICNKCVLKMDHHCPFVNNCIGFFNYKYFFNFLFWVMVFTIYIIVLVVLDGIKSRRFNIPPAIAAIICVIVLFLVSLLFFNHIRFIAINMTTIEHVEKRKVMKRNPYDLGIVRNYKQVFGTNPFLWCLPFWTTVGDGHLFEVTPDTSETSCLLSSSAS
eukprot:Phypoly_transcript_12325.p1 GENE.Phypoly_transcript_12325~~Phypoly_transcript_12325.p1  ORF type:complete len:327 (+),score=16.75 Phypoly_transcript_12325:141-983(+)